MPSFPGRDTDLFADPFAEEGGAGKEGGRAALTSTRVGATMTLPRVSLSSSSSRQTESGRHADHQR